MVKPLKPRRTRTTGGAKRANINRKRKRKLGATKKSRAVSAVPGATDGAILVFCAHGCGISYTTYPRNVNNAHWHKTLRKLNAHEAQRCPRNSNRKRTCRKTNKMRASSTANGPLETVALLEAAKLSELSTPTLPSVVASQNLRCSTKGNESGKENVLKSPQKMDKLIRCVLGNSCSDIKASVDDVKLENQELRDRLGRELSPDLSPLEPATGVYWTEPCHHYAAPKVQAEVNAAVQAEKASRIGREEGWRCYAAMAFTRRIFPEFRQRLVQRARRRYQVPKFDDWIKSELSMNIPPKSHAILKAGGSKEPKNSFGVIDTPAVLTTMYLPWGIGQEVPVQDGGATHRGNIVAIGGSMGAAVLVQFYDSNSNFKQQLHRSNVPPSVGFNEKSWISNVPNPPRTFSSTDANPTQTVSKKIVSILSCGKDSVQNPTQQSPVLFSDDISFHSCHKVARNKLATSLGVDPFDRLPDIFADDDEFSCFDCDDVNDIDLGGGSKGNYHDSITLNNDDPIQAFEMAVACELFANGTESKPTIEVNLPSLSTIDFDQFGDEDTLSMGVLSLGDDDSESLDGSDDSFPLLKKPMAPYDFEPILPHFDMVRASS